MTFRPLRLAATVTASLAALGLGAALTFAPGTPVQAEEGMWTFDNFPIDKVNAQYGTNIDQAWLDRVRLASVRIQGCSASFVSGEGLILTNHHCVVSCVQELSTAENDYVQDGWMTASREEEKTCPGQTADVLMEIVDVTDRVLAAGQGLEGQAFTQARTAEIRAIQAEACGGDDKMNCQVISFYRGGQYALYKFRRYDDVRLVFAPEFQAAFFGGDPDNFNFPRYALDAAFLRAYEDGQPAVTPNHLTWNPNAPTEGEVTFVSGNPGSTQRLLTVSQLERLRDQQLPLQLIQGSELRGRLLNYAATDEETKRVSVDTIFGLENSFKVWFGQQQALLDPAFMATKRQEEAELRAAVAADPALAQRIGDPWAELEAVDAVARDLFLPYYQLESRAGGGSTLYAIGRAIARAGISRTAPGSTITEAQLAGFADRVGAEIPIYEGIEEIQLTFWLSKPREYLTVDDPLLALIIANNANALAAATAWEEGVTVPTAQAAERIAQARFAVYGTDQYPDATFSLRLSYGQVKGWSYRGVDVPPFTYMGGLFDRATGSEPFNAAPRFLAARDRINPNTVYDFVSTNDIIGGNSGSPVINAKGEVIGAAFDGNIHSLGGAFGYDGNLNRTVTVSTAAITEALRVVYGQPALLRELGVS